MRAAARQSDSVKPTKCVDTTVSGRSPFGVSGTAERIGKGTAGQGNCIGKTGTLNYVTNLAGYCDSRGGHTFAFGIFLDGPSNEAAIQLLSRMVGPIARY